MKNLISILTGRYQSNKPTTNSHTTSSGKDKPQFITLIEAIKDSGLRKELSGKVNEASVIIGSPTDYVAGVTFNGQQYYISGTQSEWLRFYGMESGALYNKLGHIE